MDRHEKKPYVEPTIDKCERLAEVTEQGPSITSMTMVD